MNGAGLLAHLRSTTGTDSANYLEADAFVDLNASYHTIEDAIVKKIGEKFFWNVATGDGIPSQSEYTFFNQTVGNIYGTNKIYGVSIDYKNDGNFVKCFRQDTDLLEFDTTYYEKNQPISTPFYEVKDNSIFVYPYPVETVSKIRVSLSTGLIDITSSTDESNIFNGRIPKKYHYIISLGARQYSYMRQKLMNEANEAENKFNRELITMLSSLNTRVASANSRGTAPGFKVNPL